jgi:hypothetical protein
MSTYLMQIFVEKLSESKNILLESVIIQRCIRLWRFFLVHPNILYKVGLARTKTD